ncbi:MAG: class I SAM-dependent methyltransferase [Burkholderiaceae bacterium]|nr:class I SAM-dependent methyltransferase [Burkholderiaceae bacterium]
MKPIVDTAFYCCGARMQDAAQVHPICGDKYAKMFMCDYGQRIYDKFEAETLSTTSIVVRHRIMDDVLRHMLSSDAHLCIITIGAGFDSRPYRLKGGNWFELDEPPLIAYKNALLPTYQCANPLHRIPVEFCTNGLEKELAGISSGHRDSGGGPVVVILEGVFIYLNETETQKLLDSLNRQFPHLLLMCDLVKREMVRQYGQSLLAIVTKMGAPFQAVDEPESIFFNHGYHVKEIISLMDESVDLGLNMMPKAFWSTFFSDEVKGNAVYVWEK